MKSYVLNDPLLLVKYCGKQSNLYKTNQPKKNDKKQKKMESKS